VTPSTKKGVWRHRNPACR